MFSYHRNVRLAFADLMGVFERRFRLPCRSGVLRENAIADMHRKKRRIVAYVQGHHMILDELDSLDLLAFRVYEPMVTEVFKRIVKRGNVVLIWARTLAITL